MDKATSSAKAAVDEGQSDAAKEASGGKPSETKTTVPADDDEPLVSSISSTDLLFMFPSSCITPL